MISSPRVAQQAGSLGVVSFTDTEWPLNVSLPDPPRTEPGTYILYLSQVKPNGMSHQRFLATQSEGNVEPIYSPIVSLHRPLNQPVIASPAPIQFTTLQIVQRVRRGDCASAGGPNGTDYKTLRSWFSEVDVISDHLCTSALSSTLLQLA